MSHAIHHGAHVQHEESHTRVHGVLLKVTSFDWGKLCNSIWSALVFVFYGPVTYVFYALYSFLSEFIMNIEIFENTKIFAVIFGFIFGPIVVYLFGTYLTALPYYIVIPLMFIDYKKVMPALVLVMCFNFIQLLAI